MTSQVRRAVMRSPPVNPLVAIFGATGTGKSQLAVELATRFNGEVINSDAMQLYEESPIITNQIPLEERKGVPHHLLECAKLEDEPWTIQSYAKEANRVVNEIHSRGRLPILVGGTYYYAQSLLFHGAKGSHIPTPEIVKQNDIAQKYPILDASTEDILAQLKQVDPIMANRWHPNERRKIQRSLEIYLTTGRKASEIYAEQREHSSGNDASKQQLTDEPLSGTDSDRIARSGTTTSSAGLRMPTIIFWVHADPQVLQPRLDARVEDMIRKGLLHEVEMLAELLETLDERGCAVDKTRGIRVAIGFKEFQSLIAAMKSGCATEAVLKKMQLEATEQTQIATRRYAKRQVKWIRTKLLHALINSGAERQLFLLDGTDLDNWTNQVREPAIQLVRDFMGGVALPDPTSMSTVAAEMLIPKREYDLADRPDQWITRICETCKITAMTEADWTKHVTSQRHAKTSKRKAKAAMPSQLLRPDSSETGVLNESRRSF